MDRDLTYIQISDSTLIFFQTEEKDDRALYKLVLLSHLLSLPLFPSQFFTNYKAQTVNNSLLISHLHLPININSFIN